MSEDSRTLGSYGTLGSTPQPAQPGRVAEAVKRTELILAAAPYGDEFPCEDIRTILAALRDLQNEPKCRADTCCHVQNSADATTQCLEYQGQVEDLRIRFAALEEENAGLKSERDALVYDIMTIRDEGARQIEALEKERGALVKRVEVLESLVKAVGCHEFDGPFCDNVGDQNWFDLRDAALAATEGE